MNDKQKEFTIPLTLTESFINALKAVHANEVYRISNKEVGESSTAYKEHVASLKQLFAAKLIAHMGACRQDYFLTPLGFQVYNKLTKASKRKGK